MNLFPAQGIQDLTKTPYTRHHEEIEILKQKIQFLRRSKGIKEVKYDEAPIRTIPERKFSGKFLGRTIPKQVNFNSVPQQTQE